MAIIISVGGVENVPVNVEDTDDLPIGIEDKVYIKGDKGDKGDRGEPGPRGFTGETGAPGRDGVDGAPGRDGSDGADGSNGATFTPSVSAEGVISWTNDGGLPNPASVNIKGDTGATGADGQDGVSPAVSVSSITGGHAVTITDADHPGGQSFNVMDGEDGDTGPVGPGVPAGGVAGQILGKSSATDYDTAWTSHKIPFAVVDNTSTSTKFTATVPGIAALEDGVSVLLKNGVVTSASGFTININGLGAKPAYNNMAAASAETTIFNINYTMLFVYDSTRVAGGAWICYRGCNSDTNTIGYQIRMNSTAIPTAIRSRYYRIFFTAADNEHWEPANTGYDNSATSAKTVNTRPINPFGPIAYTSASTNYTAGTAVAAATLWYQYAFALGYSFNTTGAALTLTYPAPVFVKCAPQSNGSAVIDSTTPYVQALPSTADGKIYIYLGMAYSATNIELHTDHPVYEYKDGAIRLWTGAKPSGMLCTITAEYDEVDEYDEVYTSDKTAQEVYGMLGTGVNPVFRFHNLLDTDAYIYASMTKLESTADGEELTLSSFQTDAMIADTLSDYFTLTVHGEAPAVQKTVSGSLITITDALAEPAVALSTAINPVQSGSGDPSPSNVRPISGWTGANVTRTVLNLWGGDVLAEAFRGCTGYAKDTTTKTITFNRAPTSPYHMTLCAVPFKPLTRYTLLAQYSNGGQNTSMMVEYTDGTSAQISFDNSSNAKTSRAFVTASGKTVKEFCLNYKSTSKTTIYYEESGVFEGVLTYNDFEAYNGTTFPFDWTSTAGTVYGGTLDVVNGTLTVDNIMVTIGNSTNITQWVQSADGYIYVAYPDLSLVRDGVSHLNIISNCYKVVNPNSMGANSHAGDAGVYVSGTNRRIQVASIQTTVEDFKTEIGQLNPQFVIPLATPQTYTLTPTEVQMLLGTNNVWSDTGDTTLTYLADGRVNSLTALNMLLGNMYTPSADVSDREALDIIMGETT